MSKVKKKLKEILTKNPEAIAEFECYYKYQFAFRCEGVYFEIGGDSSEIYRLDVYPQMKLKDLVHVLEDD